VITIANSIVVGQAVTALLVLLALALRKTWARASSPR
jgi:multisubunit Na+/H+ antiporter MnhC subunit